MGRARRDALRPRLVQMGCCPSRRGKGDPRLSRPLCGPGGGVAGTSPARTFEQERPGRVPHQSGGGRPGRIGHNERYGQYPSYPADVPLAAGQRRGAPVRGKDLLFLGEFRTGNRRTFGPSAGKEHRRGSHPAHPPGFGSSGSVGRRADAAPFVRSERGGGSLHDAQPDYAGERELLCGGARFSGHTVRFGPEYAREDPQMDPAQ